MASIYHAGGTTGAPKLDLRTHFKESSMALNFNLVLDLNAGETILCGLPLFHCNGTGVTGSVPFSLGAQIVLLSPGGQRGRGQKARKCCTHQSVPRSQCALRRGEAEDR